MYAKISKISLIAKLVKINVRENFDLFSFSIKFQNVKKNLLNATQEPSINVVFGKNSKNKPG